MLLPNKYKKLGWNICIPSALVGIFLIATNFEYFQLNTTVFAIINDDILNEKTAFSFIQRNITGTLVGSLFIIGALLVGFSKEKYEDEYVLHLRLTSLLWATLINYILLLLALVFVYGISFLNVMVYQMFSTLIIYIARFNFILYRNKQKLPHEKYA